LFITFESSAAGRNDLAQFCVLVGSIRFHHPFIASSKSTEGKNSR
jgi:hypothetical protein